MNYFKSRNPREQALILGMLALLFLFCLWQFVIAPISAMKTDSARARAAALRDYAIVTSGAPQIAAASASVSGTQAFNREAIVAAAAGQELTISRLQNEAGGSLKVWFEDVSSAQVYGFLSALTGDYAASIEGVQISRRNEGKVSAQITLGAI